MKALLPQLSWLVTSSLLPDPSSQANNEGSGPGLQVRDLSQVQALRDLILCEGGLIPVPFSLWSHPQNFRLKKLKGCKLHRFFEDGIRRGQHNNWTAD